MEKILLLSLLVRSYVFTNKDSCLPTHNCGIGSLNQGLFAKF